MNSTKQNLKTNTSQFKVPEKRDLSNKRIKERNLPSSSINNEKAALEKRLREMEAENERNRREKEELLKELKRKKLKIKDPIKGKNGDRMEDKQRLKMRMEMKDRKRQEEMERRRRAAKILGRDGG